MDSTKDSKSEKTNRALETANKTLERANKTIEQAKEKYGGAMRVIFGRTGLMIVAVIIQIFILLAVFHWLSDKLAFVFGGFSILSIAVVLYIVNRNENPAYQLSWVILVLLFPVFGALLYIFIRLQMGVRRMALRMSSMQKVTDPFLKQDEGVMEELSDDPDEAQIARYMNKYGHFPMYGDTGLHYFPLGDDVLEIYLDELRSAKKYIFMEYFIIGRGEVWSEILDILIEKAREGVEVRLMYDGMNCLSRLPYRYPKKLEQFGIKCKMFSPVVPALSSYQNNRDHRKITVIDGITAFTGGVNLADEYFNKEVRFGHWKDEAIMVRGRAVNSFLMMFLQTWNVSEKQDEDVSVYWDAGQQELLGKPEDIDTGVPGEDLKFGGFAMPFGDSPLDGESVAKSVYLDIINEAHDYVYIMTPYLVLDDDMVTALTFAAKRGVRMVIVMPHIPDKRYAFVLAHSYYRELINAGVEIYEYTPGFVHAKVFLSDDERAVVGSINLDYRSLYLHFECGVYLCKNPVLADIYRDFEETLRQCHRVTEQDCRDYPLLKRMAGSVMRVFAPLM